MKKNLLYLVGICGCGLAGFRTAQAIDDIPEGQTFLIQGNSATGNANIQSSGFQVFGTLRLQSRDGGWSSSLTLTDGALTNALAGLIEVNQGSGGPRLISGDLFNFGTFNANFGLTLSKANGVYDNLGAFNIAAAQTVTISGQNQVFNQKGGTLALGGALDLSNLAFNYEGGLITGRPYLMDCDLKIGPEATNGASFLQTGGGTFTGDLGLGQSIWVQGNSRAGNTVLTTVAGFRNEGTLLLESRDAGWNSSLTVVNGVLTNAEAGVITVGTGSGGPRTISAHLLNLGTINANDGLTLSKAGGVYDNRGAFNIASGQTVTISGQNQVFNQKGGRLAIAGALDLTALTFNYGGGLITGRPYLIDCDLTISPSATNGASFLQTGGSSTFAGDLGLGQSIWVQGNSRAGNTVLTTVAGFRNEGTLLLESRDAGWNSSLTVVNGVLTNAEAGVITVGTGNGGPRTISAHLLNLGTFNANKDLTLSKANGVYDNKGALNIASNMTVNIAGQGQVFNQISGILDIDGGLVLSDMLLNFEGGQITGTPYLINCDLVIRPRATGAASFTQTGGGSTFTGDLSAGQSIWLQGNGTGGHSLLTITNGFRNDGRLLLESRNGGYASSLTLQSGVLTNTESGVITVGVGNAGPRTLTADLLNLGTVNVNQSLTLNKANGAYDNQGTFKIASGQATSISGTGQLAIRNSGTWTIDGTLDLGGQGVFNQNGGTLAVNGLLDQEGLRFNFNGGTISGNRPYLVNSVLTIASGATNAGGFT
ncbi:MAG: hypothetical protein HY674_02595, partial [Chloroflexi bacterium]|nr:hypothetical protein [Chloroflexota bacterium]